MVIFPIILSDNFVWLDMGLPVGYGFTKHREGIEHLKRIRVY